MATGRKTGGRSKGTPNKRTSARRLGVEELLTKYRYDPLEAMIAEAADPKVDPDVRRALHQCIAPFVYPKLKSVEAKVESSIDAYKDLVGLTDEELEALVVRSLTTEQILLALQRSEGPEDRLRRALPDEWREQEIMRIVETARGRALALD